MNKVFSIAFVLLAMSTQAQTYVGLKGAAMSSLIMNKNIFDAGDELDYKASFSGGFSVAAIHLFGGSSGIALNLGVSNLNQQFTSDQPDGDVVAVTKLKYTDLGLFYTYLTEGGLYIEAGPQFSFRNPSITQINDKGGNDEDEFTMSDDYLAKTNIYAIFGLGGMINISEEIKLSLGARLGYGINDMTEELSQSDYVALSQSDEEYTLFTDFAQGAYFDEDANEDKYNYQSTHPALLSFNLGVYYTFGQ